MSVQNNTKQLSLVTFCDTLAETETLLTTGRRKADTRGSSLLYFQGVIGMRHLVRVHRHLCAIARLQKLGKKKVPYSKKIGQTYNNSE